MNGAKFANAIDRHVHADEELLNRFRVDAHRLTMESGTMQRRLKGHKNTTGKSLRATLFVSLPRAGIVKF